MFIWCSILFFLGVLAFIDAIFNMGEIFRRANSVLFLLISLALLIRTTTKMKTQKNETLQTKVFELEQRLRTLENEHTPSDMY